MGFPKKTESGGGNEQAGCRRVISEDEKAYACYQDTYEIEKGRARQSAALRPWFCFEYFIKKGMFYMSGQ